MVKCGKKKLNILCVFLDLYSQISQFGKNGLSVFATNSSYPRTCLVFFVKSNFFSLANKYLAGRSPSITIKKKIKKEFLHTMSKTIGWRLSQYSEKCKTVLLLVQKEWRVVYNLTPTWQAPSHVHRMISSSNFLIPCPIWLKFSELDFNRACNLLKLI